MNEKEKTRNLKIAIVILEGIFLAIVKIGLIGIGNIGESDIITPIKWLSGVLACVLFVILVNCENGKYKTNAVLMLTVNAALLINA